ncbi:helix-turn-helix domain-containing protein [Streptomyces sp. NPDC091377]|uniref:helix-turn-helix domain-containing protein n=1 Tax=Streptomyces sp. NPDC091377 TaxID=3365995 RepID=UPI00381712A3
MPGATGAGEAEEFAALLRQLKDRSGLSYGALAKRLHMSTSTLHRYCNGSAVPNEYAPVERIARVCRATSRERVELHRHWILADAARKRRAEPPVGAERTEPTEPAPPTAGPDEAAPAAAEPLTAPEPDPAGPAEPAGPADPLVADVPRQPASSGSRPRMRRRSTLVASAVTAVALLAALVFVVRPGSDDGGKDTAGGPAAGATGQATDDTGQPSPTPSRSGRSRSPSASPSATASDDPKGGAGAAPTADGDDGDGGDGGGSGDSDAVPLTVGTRPYVYDSPCSQHFLVDSEPAQMGPPANEQDAPRWAAAYGAVSSDEQRIALTVQGTGADTVVLEDLHVRVVSKGTPLAWNDYAMGVGCGGGVETRSFHVDLDDGSPAVAVKNGQRDFPYKVSESDPEVFYVTARTGAHDVRWDLTLDWSSGDRRGTLHLDNSGTPFRTSANVSRPGYDYPPGGGEWIERMDG